MTTAEIYRVVQEAGPDDWLWLKTRGGVECAVQTRRDPDGREIVIALQVVDQSGLRNDTVRSVSLPALEAHLNKPVVEDPAKQRTRHRRLVQRPKTRSYPESFYRNVAQVYAELNDARVAPAPTIAEMAGVPVPTVHGWIRQARRIGVMPKGRQGRAG